MENARLINLPWDNSYPLSQFKDKTDKNLQRTSSDIPFNV